MVMDEKIAKVYQNLKQEGIDDVRAKDIIQKIEEYYDCLSDFNLEELDYYSHGEAPGCEIRCSHGDILSPCATAYGSLLQKWNFICFCSKRKRKCLQIRKFSVSLQR